MPSLLNPYVMLPGTAREAVAFYESVFGGQATLTTFGEAGGPDAPNADQVMHAELRTPSGYALMVSDAPPGQELSRGNDVALSLSGDDADELRRYWAALSEGGTVTVPLEVQVWGDEFGMCTDRFGVTWMVDITGPAA